MVRVFAAADIGSNTAHLLVAATDGELVMRIDNYNEWIPLGETVSRTGQVPKEMVQQLCSAVKEFRRVCREKQAQSVYLFATEGLRMARNHETVTRKIQNETGIRVEIIPPSREAELSLRGLMLDMRNIGADVMFEVGGGSAQVGLLSGRKLTKEISLPLGTGRVIAESGLGSPCSEVSMRAAENYIERILSNCELVQEAKVAIASGGVGRGLWRALHPDGEKLIAAEEVDYVIWATSRLPVDRIINRFGVKPKRAGTLLAGALVYRSLMRRFGVKEIVVSEFGIREGAILEMAAGKVLGCPV